MKLKKLKNIKQFINIYKLYQSSFPIEEKKPFWLIIIGVFRKNFEVFSLENTSEEFLGLAITLNHKDLVLLDYLAISTEIQSRGYGSKALSLLKEQYKNYRFFLEIENPYDYSAPNLSERQKRQKFYLKNGFFVLPFHTNLFGVEMELLGNNCSLSFDEYHDLYINQFGGFMKKYITENVTLIKM